MMSTPNPRVVLNQPISVPNSALSSDVKEAIVTGLWATSLPLDYIDSEFDAYFRYYNDQCHSRLDTEHAAQTHKNIIDIVLHIQNHSHESKTDLRDRLKIVCPRLGEDS